MGENGGGNAISDNWIWAAAGAAIGFILGYEYCRRTEVEPLRRETEDSFRAIAQAASGKQAQQPVATQAPAPAQVQQQPAAVTQAPAPAGQSQPAPAVVQQQAQQPVATQAPAPVVQQPAKQPPAANNPSAGDLVLTGEEAKAAREAAEAKAAQA